MKEQDSFPAVEKKVTLSCLLAFYGSMLTENQLEMARLHWEEDYSLAEIAAQFSVSRQSVHDTVSRTEKQLEGLEEKLGMMKRSRLVEAGLKSALREISLSPSPMDAHIQSARDTLVSLLNQEEE